VFELGNLGEGVFVKNTQYPVLTGRDEDFRFFTTWLDQKLAKGMVSKAIKGMTIH